MGADLSSMNAIAKPLTSKVAAMAGKSKGKKASIKVKLKVSAKHG
jgi:hypothetical protein